VETVAKNFVLALACEEERVVRGTSSLVSCVVSTMVVVMPVVVQAKAVLWDTSRDSGFDNYLLYSDIINHLETNKSISVERNTGDFLSTDLSSYDALVISVLTSRESEYSSAEVTKITDFINSGGGLLIMGDNSSVPNSNIQPIASQFGLSLGASSPNPVPFVLSLDDSHPIFDGVSQLHFQGPGQLLVSTPSVELAWVDDGGLNKSLVAAAKLGSSNVITIGDADMMMNSYYTLQDNLKFSENTFEYITSPAPEPSTLVLLSLGICGLLRSKVR